LMTMRFLNKIYRKTFFKIALLCIILVAWILDKS